MLKSQLSGEEYGKKANGLKFLIKFLTQGNRCV